MDDDELESLIMRQQGELDDDVEAADVYGRSHPETYGGVRLEGGGRVAPARLTVAFTEDVERHAEALRSLVPHPDRVDVQACPHSDKACRELADRVVARIQSTLPDLRSLFVDSSPWSGVTVLVRADDLDAVRLLLADEPAVTVSEGEFRPWGRA